MNTIKMMIALCALLVTPFVSKSQSLTEYLNVTWEANTSPTNQSGWLKVGTNTSLNNNLTAVGQSLQISSGKTPFEYVHLAYIKIGGGPGYAEYHTASIPISTLVAMPYNSQSVFSGTHNSEFTVTKGNMYSTPGVPMHMFISVSFYTPY